MSIFAVFFSALDHSAREFEYMRDHATSAVFFRGSRINHPGFLILGGKGNFGGKGRLRGDLFEFKLLGVSNYFFWGMGGISFSYGSTINGACGAQ